MENLFAQSGKSFCSKWKIFLPVAETAACGGAGKVGEGVINLSTNFLNATSLIRKEEKCYLRMDFTCASIATQGRGEK